MLAHAITVSCKFLVFLSSMMQEAKLVNGMIVEQAWKLPSQLGLAYIKENNKGHTWAAEAYILSQQQACATSFWLQFHHTDSPWS